MQQTQPLKHEHEHEHEYEHEYEHEHQIPSFDEYLTTEQKLEVQPQTIALSSQKIIEPKKYQLLPVLGVTFGPVFWFSFYTYAYLYEVWYKNINAWLDIQTKQKNIKKVGKPIVTTATPPPPPMGMLEPPMGTLKTTKVMTNNINAKKKSKKLLKFDPKEETKDVGQQQQEEENEVKRSQTKIKTVVVAQSCLVQLFQRWFYYALYRLPCPLCAQHVKSWLAEHPLKFTTPSELYENIFLLYRHVSLKIGKSEAQTWTKQSWLRGIREHIKQPNFTVFYAMPNTKKDKEEEIIYQAKNRENIENLNFGLYWLHCKDGRRATTDNFGTLSSYCSPSFSSTLSSFSSSPYPRSITTTSTSRKKMLSISPQQWEVSTSAFTTDLSEHATHLITEVQKSKTVHNLKFKINMSKLNINEKLKEDVQFLLKITQPRRKIPLWGKLIYLEHLEIVLQNIEVFCEKNIEEIKRLTEWIQVSGLLLFPHINWEIFNEILSDKGDLTYSVRDPRYWYRKLTQFGIHNLDPSVDLYVKQPHYIETATDTTIRTIDLTKVEMDTIETEKNNIGKLKVVAKVGWKFLTVQSWSVQHFETKAQIRSQSLCARIVPKRGIGSEAKFILPEMKNIIGHAGLNCDGNKKNNSARSSDNDHDISGSNGSSITSSNNSNSSSSSSSSSGGGNSSSSSSSSSTSSNGGSVSVKNIKNTEIDNISDTSVKTLIDDEKESNNKSNTQKTTVTTEEKTITNDEKDDSNQICFQNDLIIETQWRYDMFMRITLGAFFLFALCILFLFCKK